MECKSFYNLISKYAMLFCTFFCSNCFNCFLK